MVNIFKQIRYHVIASLKNSETLRTLLFSQKSTEKILKHNFRKNCKKTMSITNFSILEI